MAETSTLGLYVGDLVQEADNGMSVFEFLELIAGYAVQSNMEKIDNAMNVFKNKLSNYTSENVYITDHQKEGIENKQSEFNWTKNNQVEYIAKLLGGYEKGILTVENTNITSDKSDILFTITQGFSKLNNTATSGISEIQLAKSLLCERIMLDIKNDNDSIVYLTVYITVNGVQTTTQMTVPAKTSVQKSFYNSIIRDLDSNSTIKFQAQTNGLPLIINSGSKAQYDYIDIDKISNLGDNFSDIIDNIYNELRNDIDGNVTEIGNILGKTTTLENNLYNPNLLINSNFKISELVNQRSQTSYTNKNTYCIDMFKAECNDSTFSVDLTGTYLKLIGSASATYLNLIQKIENMGDLFTNKLTLSAMVKINKDNGYVRIGFANGGGQRNYNLPKDEWTLIKYTSNVTLSATSNPYLQIIGDETLEIKYFKMEVGEIATKFVDDDPATKLAKCQRYLQKIWGSGLQTSAFMGWGQSFSSTYANISLDLPTPLRAIPTLTYGGKLIFEVGGISLNTVTNISLGGGNSLKNIQVSATTTNLIAGQMGRLRANNDSTAYILLSAEL